MYPDIKAIIYICLAVAVISWAYAAWTHNRLLNCLSKYGSTVIPDVYHSAYLDQVEGSSRQSRRMSPLVSYIHKKDFEKEELLEIREAGRRAYKGQLIGLISLPTIAAAIFLWLYFIKPL